MKMERFNEILNKLMQMEDAEENLEMVPLYEEALELSKEIYGEYVTSKPARSCVAVKQLPKNALVEVEVIAEK